MSNKLFVISGHGAGDNGAPGNGFLEAERVRALATKIKQYGGESVILSDFALNSYQSNIIGKGLVPKDCVILELHLDSSRSASAKGGHVIINGNLKPDKYDAALAEMISDMFPGRSQIIVKRTDLANVNRSYQKGYNYRLMECCFISNANDIKKFNSNLDELAKKILKCFEIESDLSKPKWVKDEVGWWYRHADGSYTTNGWEKIGNEWFYFDAKGYVAKENSWLKINNRWYYFNERNAAVKGYQTINGNLYYFVETSNNGLDECQLLMTDGDGAILKAI